VQVSTAAGVRGTMKPQIYTLLPAAAVQKQHSNIINWSAKTKFVYWLPYKPFWLSVCKGLVCPEMYIFFFNSSHWGVRRRRRRRRRRKKRVMTPRLLLSIRWQMTLSLSSVFISHFFPFFAGLVRHLGFFFFFFLLLCTFFLKRHLNEFASCLRTATAT